MQLYTKYEFIQLLLLPLVFKQKAYQTTEQFNILLHCYILVLKLILILFVVDNFALYLVEI